MDVLKELEGSMPEWLTEIDEGIILLDQGGVIRYANEAAIYMLDTEPLEGRRFAEVCVLMNLPTQSMLPDISSKAMESCETVDFPEDSGVVRNFGDQIYLKGSATPLKNKIGGIYGCRIRMTDITASKRLELQLKYERRSLSVMFGAAGVGMLVLDEHGSILNVNPAAQKILQCDQDSAVGLQFGDAFSCMNSIFGGCGSGMACEVCPVRSNINSAISDDSFSGQFTVLMRRMPGTNKPLVWIKIFVSQTWDSGNKQIVLSLIDISERKMREQELEKARLEAEAASRAKDQFLANMSHEIRTPINGMTGMIDLTLQSDLTEEQQEYLISAKQCSEYLLRIINDILDYSKLECGKMLLEELRFDLRDVVEHVLMVHTKIANGKDLFLKADLADDLPQFVRGDPLRLRQILHNLITNALKFTSEGGVTVSLKCDREAEPPMLRFSVNDTGIGMEKEDIGKLFKAFSQVDGSTTRRFGGTGLGLMIVKDLITAMKGEVHVESEPGVGSTFFFSIPCIEEEEADEEIRDKTIFVRPVEEPSAEEPLADDDSDIADLLKYCEDKMGDTPSEENKEPDEDIADLLKYCEKKLDE